MTVQVVTTEFSKQFVETAKWLATASELDGQEMKEALKCAETCAMLVLEEAYHASDIELHLAANLFRMVQMAKDIVR